MVQKLGVDSVTPDGPAEADNLIVRYQGLEASLVDGYKRFANSMLDALQACTLDDFEPFVFETV